MPSGETALISDGMSQKIIETAEQLVLSSGPETLTVRRILQTLGITNRVFYNRFHTIAQVLDIVYRNTALKIRESVAAGFDPEGDFFAQAIDIVVNTLVMYGEAFGAEEMVPVTAEKGHLVTSFGLSMMKPVYDLMDQLIEGGAVNGQKFSVDPRPLDPNVPTNLLQKLVFKFMYSKQDD